MSDPVRVANKVKATVHRDCHEVVAGDGAGKEHCEYLVYLSVPKAGGDGILLGVSETPEAADAIASALNSVFGMVHTHV